MSEAELKLALALDEIAKINIKFLIMGVASKVQEILF